MALYYLGKEITGLPFNPSGLPKEYESSADEFDYTLKAQMSSEENASHFINLCDELSYMEISIPWFIENTSLYFLGNREEAERTWKKYEEEITLCFMAAIQESEDEADVLGIDEETSWEKDDFTRFIQKEINALFPERHNAAQKLETLYQVRDLIYELRYGKWSQEVVATFLQGINEQEGDTLQSRLYDYSLKIESECIHLKDELDL